MDGFLLPGLSSDLASWLQILLYLVVLLAAAKPLGEFMARVYDGRPHLLSRAFGGVERRILRIGGLREDDQMGWKDYALALLSFSVVGALAVYGLQRAQAALPLNPADMAAVPAGLAFNTAASFVSNTNWQAYGGEATMSYLTQMLGLTVQNFVSAASGMAVLVALVRGIRARQAEQLGSFWVDLVRGTLYILLPLSTVMALVLVATGVVQTLRPYAEATLVEPSAISRPVLDAAGERVLDAAGEPVTESVPLTTQTLALGPAASQIAIKQLGTNGGGFFNVNSAHPFENPTPWSNVLEMLAILLVPAALCVTFGRMIGDMRQAWALLAAMTILLVALLLPAVAAEQAGNPRLAALGVDDVAGSQQAGGNMEGKELRFGVTNSALWATATTAASNGSVNAMHDAFTPIGGLVPLFLMLLGEVVFGGVGSGLYGMLVFAILAVFAAGLMVGRTPEYLGKKIEAYEIKMASIVILVPSIVVLVLTAAAVSTAAGSAAVFNPGAHGFSEVLYAFASMGNNNGSAFGGLGANAPFYNLLGGLGMLIGRFAIMVPVLAIAGSLAAKTSVPVGPGTLPTHTPLFVVLLIATVVIVGALTFIPALALGPIVEHLLLWGIGQ